jgi:hypothetical protein
MQGFESLHICDRIRSGMLPRSTSCFLGGQETVGPVSDSTDIQITVSLLPFDHMILPPAPERNQQSFLKTFFDA